MQRQLARLQHAELQVEQASSKLASSLAQLLSYLSYNTLQAWQKKRDSALLFCCKETEMSWSDPKYSSHGTARKKRGHVWTCTVIHGHTHVFRKFDRSLRRYYGFVKVH